MQHFPDDAWDAWTPELLFQRFRYQSSPWYVVGGWALDLWQGYQSRDHEDLEFCILSDDLDLFRAQLPELEISSRSITACLLILLLEMRPRPETHQLWGADTANACWRIDMMIEHGHPGNLDLQARPHRCGFLDRLSFEKHHPEFLISLLLSSFCLRQNTFGPKMLQTSRLRCRSFTFRKKPTYDVGWRRCIPDMNGSHSFKERQDDRYWRKAAICSAPHDHPP
ncbi:MAG: hypothetical protein U5N27_17630 [Rhizobium sp.]|nr:hypothetical protein [Rhizobium sp.]